MKICGRGLNFFQVIDYLGTVRLCGWMSNCSIGKLTEQSIEEIYHGKKANNIRLSLANKDYSNCVIDACPYLSKNIVEDKRIEINEVPKYPQELYLAYENVCNYQCTSCNLPLIMNNNKSIDLEECYERIEREIKKALPYVKTLSANGVGELFVSKRILKLLADWRPITPSSEISVLLETNGSLFDEHHWSKIENLGQYNLTVFITIMSFDEKIYQILSGVNYPISKIEENLRFVKSLKEKGIINRLEIATVVQERNFRTMPEFTRRSIEEFGADSVRLRPYAPWEAKPFEHEWFADVRNKYHPYHEEYLEIMKDPIFKHPKADDWGGGKSSQIGDYPYKQYIQLHQIEKKRADILLTIIENDDFISWFGDEIGISELIIYGLGHIGRVITKLIHDKVKFSYIIDRGIDINEYMGKKILSLSEIDDTEKDELILITLLNDVDKVKEELKEKKYIGKVIDIEEIINKYNCMSPNYK